MKLFANVMMKITYPLVAASFALAFTACGSGATALTETEAKLRQFHQNPRAFMNQTPPKKDRHGRPLRSSPTVFSARDVRSGLFVDKKSAYRKGRDPRGRDLGQAICNAKGVCLGDIMAGRAQAQFRIMDFLDARELGETGGRPIINLGKMNGKLQSAKLNETPWSDHYWPINEGILGARYASNSFAASGPAWKNYHEFVTKQGNTLLDVYLRGNSEEIDELSPSEKYDLLIGDVSKASNRYEQGFITPYMWLEGRGYADANGMVETWMGICHGWAPAAFMLPRPTRAITVPAADGKTPIKLYPSDLKGLASHLWANEAPEVRFLGGRCNDKSPKTDPQTGRVLDEQCFDVNPANWHVAVVNQIGVAKRSLVLDATYDYEVWNQPIYSYSYKYFNPQTGQETDKLKAAYVRLQDYTNDKFKSFRSPKAHSVVGISMQLSYIAETLPNQTEKDDPSFDNVVTVTYLYDLELDENGDIVGGEWYYNRHPDFLWMPSLDGRAGNPGDQQLYNGPQWNAETPLPPFWADIAVKVGARYGQPMGAIIDSLLKRSNAGRAERVK